MDGLALLANALVIRSLTHSRFVISAVSRPMAQQFFAWLPPSIGHPRSNFLSLHDLQTQNSALQIGQSMAFKWNIHSESSNRRCWKWSAGSKRWEKRDGSRVKLDGGRTAAQPRVFAIANSKGQQESSCSQPSPRAHSTENRKPRNAGDW